ncbi:MAG: hypothetical protein GX808_08285 [Syntrophomonadaceae bacterium]|nr:hypothetical protein [Syntrophomonadaceae bacterium]
MLNVYKENYERVGYIESYSYLSWVRRYSEVGEFELKCAPENLPLLSLGNLLSKSGDKEAGLIETILVESVEEEIITVRGRFLPVLLESRIIWNTENLQGDIGDCIGQLIESNAINPVDEDRLISNLDYENLPIGKNISMQVSFKNLLDTITSILSEAGIGIKGILSGNEIILSLYMGREQPFVFSREFENLLSQNYTDSIKDYANLAKIAGEGEGSEREMIVVGSKRGKERKEIFIDAKDLRLSEYENNEKYLEALKIRGNEKLYEMRRRESFDAVANTNSNLVYKVDFDLGDIVTVKSSLLGISKRLRITEIVESYDADGLHVDLVFGDPLPTLNEKLKGVI